MQQFKIEHFAKTHPGEPFPAFTPVSGGDARQLVARLATRFGLGESATPRDVSRALAAAGRPVQDADAEAEGFDLAATLARLGVRAGRHAYVSWERFREVDRFALADLSRHFDDVWYPSSDDVEIFDHGMTWVLTVSHEGELAFVDLRGSSGGTGRDGGRPIAVASHARTADPSMPAFLARPPGAPVYHGFLVLEDVAVDGFTLGTITDFEARPTPEGDAFVVAPDDSRAGLVWEVADPAYVQEIGALEPGRWGVWAVGFPHPMDSRDSARRNLAAVLPRLRPEWERWRRTVWLRGYRAGLLKISLTQLIQREAGLGLRAAKHRTDALLEGRRVAVELPSLEAAQRFKEAAAELGAIVVER